MKKYKKWYIWGPALHTIQEFCENLSKKDSVKLFCPEEYEINGNDITYKEIGKLCKDLEIVFGAYDEKYYKNKTDIFECKNTKLTLWKNYFLYHVLDQWDSEHLPINKKITSLYTCMNHRPHEHRILMIDTLARENLLIDNYITWHLLDEDVKKSFQYWKPEITTLDEINTDCQFHIPVKFPDQMYSSLLDLVNETTVSDPFITEKTYNAIVYKKPFIIFGYPGAHKYLEKMGFKLPRHVIDYGFDEIQDTKERCEKIVQELKRLSKLDLNLLNKQMKNIVDHNQKHAFNIIKNQYGIPDCIKKDKQYKRRLKVIKWKLDLLESAS